MNRNVQFAKWELVDVAPSDEGRALWAVMRKTFLSWGDHSAFGGYAQFTDVSNQLSLTTHHYGGFLGAGSVLPISMAITSMI